MRHAQAKRATNAAQHTPAGIVAHGIDCPPPGQSKRVQRSHATLGGHCGKCPAGW